MYRLYMQNQNKQRLVIKHYFMYKLIVAHSRYYDEIRKDHEIAKTW